MTSSKRRIPRRALLRGARGRSLSYTLEQLNPLLRGWAAYFKLASGTFVTVGTYDQIALL